MESMSVQEQVLMQVRHDAHRAERKEIQELSKEAFDNLVFDRWADYQWVGIRHEDYVSYSDFYSEQFKYYKR